MISWILQGIEDAVWDVFVFGFLYLIDAFKDIINFLSGGIITQIFFKDNTSSFSFKTIPWPFFIFCIIAAAIICIIFITQYVILLFSDNGKVKSKLITAVKMSGLATVFVFFIPIGFLLLNSIVSFISRELNQVLGTNFSLAGMLYHVGDSNWDGVTTYCDNYGPPDNILQYNLIVEILAVWCVGFALGVIGLTLIQKIFELFFLFIVSPLVAATMPVDDGKRMLIWKDLTMAKAVSSLGGIVIYYVFTFGLQAILSVTVTQVSSGAERELLVGIIVTSGAFATFGFTRIVNNISGERKGMRGQLLAGLASAALTAKALTSSPTAIVASAVKNGLKGQTNYNKDDSYEVNMKKLANNFESSQAGSNRVADRNAFVFLEQRASAGNKTQRQIVAKALSSAQGFQIKNRSSIENNKAINIKTVLKKPQRANKPQK